MFYVDNLYETLTALWHHNKNHRDFFFFLNNFLLGLVCSNPAFSSFPVVVFIWVKSHYCIQQSWNSLWNGTFQNKNHQDFFFLEQLIVGPSLFASCLSSFWEVVFKWVKSHYYIWQSRNNLQKGTFHVYSLEKSCWESVNHQLIHLHRETTLKCHLPKESLVIFYLQQRCSLNHHPRRPHQLKDQYCRTPQQSTLCQCCKSQLDWCGRVKLDWCGRVKLFAPVV